MTFEKQEHPAQLDLCEKLEAPLSNAERQRKHREKQKKLGRKARTMFLTDDEQFYLERVLLTLRKTGGVPAMVRNAKGQLEPVDL